MNKFRKTYRIIAGFMAVLMLSINIGFSADIHFCGGAIADIAFYGHAHSCGEMDTNSFCDMKGPSVNHHSLHEVIIKPTNTCCKDFTLEIQLEVESNTTTYLDLIINLDIAKTNVTTFLPYVISSKFDNAQTRPIAFETYKSPVIPMDIYVQLDRFLI